LACFGADIEHIQPKTGQEMVPQGGFAADSAKSDSLLAVMCELPCRRAFTLIAKTGLNR
jgi:hypothetical protein